MLFIRMLSIISLFGIISLGTLEASAKPWCDISLEKKRLIQDVLCGKFAAEREYIFTGPTCVNQSISKRIEDSALHVHGLHLCGYNSLADEVKEASLRVVSFMEILSVCVSQQINIHEIFEDRLKSIRNKMSNITCSGSFKSRIKNRLPYFRESVKSFIGPNITDEVYNKLGVSVDSQNNIKER